VGKPINHSISVQLTNGIAGGMEGTSRTASGDPVTLKTVEAMQKLKLTLKKRGTHGIITLGRKFKSMDDDGSGSLGLTQPTPTCSLRV